MNFQQRVAGHLGDFNVTGASSQIVISASLSGAVIESKKADVDTQGRDSKSSVDALCNTNKFFAKAYKQLLAEKSRRGIYPLYIISDGRDLVLDQDAAVIAINAGNITARRRMLLLALKAKDVTFDNDYPEAQARKKAKEDKEDKQDKVTKQQEAPTPKPKDDEFDSRMWFCKDVPSPFIDNLTVESFVHQLTTMVTDVPTTLVVGGKVTSDGETNWKGREQV